MACWSRSERYSGGLGAGLVEGRLPAATLFCALPFLLRDVFIMGSLGGQFGFLVSGDAGLDVRMIATAGRSW
jgi:hypothetical protein